MKAIILAGGFGERLRPLTLETPKPLLKIRGKPIVERAIENLKEHNIDEIILSIGYKADMIKNYFEKFNIDDNNPIKIHFHIEEVPLGTGGSVKEITEKFNITEDFILLWGDNIANFNISEMINDHKANNASITMALTHREDVENFGVAHIVDKKIIGFIEKPKREEAPSKLINAGAFIIHPKVLQVLPVGKSSIERECFEKIVKDGELYAFNHSGYWYPTDTLEKYNFVEEDIIKHLLEDLN
ncbi:MAG: nucleotidyltransferase family protein [Candidatus Pacearchaeota archaeon]|jgi:NDP-sugar pyrophosphorylase family protein